MKININFIYTTFFLFFFSNLFCYEIIRDPIFEDYFREINEELKLDKIKVYLIKNKTANAFVIENNIYFTTGLLKELDDEDTLKAIYLHEYGHILKNHFQAKKINIQQSQNVNTFYSLFSVGLAAISGNANIGLGTSITLNSSLINNLSKHSVEFEIEADNFMIDQIKKNKINIKELVKFMDNLVETRGNYFRTHPRSNERINILKEINYIRSENSEKFEWIKSKYSKNSKNKSFNLFFQNLEKGIYDQDNNLNIINKKIIQYEAFKKGFLIENWHINFKKLLDINDSSFLKIEYINYLLDNNLNEKYYIIEDYKYDNNIINEYFYSYIFGKYYDKINNKNLSNFYFCQFYKSINSKNKADFFCQKYDIKDIPLLDKSHALFK